ncbi:hypothetical protein KVP97_02835, partial [Escherichia coli]|nr:hypothetical protein [Escherichia coli]
TFSCNVLNFRCFVGRIRRSRRIRHKQSAPLRYSNCLMRYAYQAYFLLQCIEFSMFCRPDKAFTPHPA